ncbi:hypothetical protein [Simonsiella muelleri]|nr:hypothetical protein [Simonsiella muelleri]
MKSFQDKVNEQNERIEKEITLQHKLLKWGVILLVTGYIFRLFIS